MQVMQQTGGNPRKETRYTCALCLAENGDQIPLCIHLCFRIHRQRMLVLRIGIITVFLFYGNCPVSFCDHCSYMPFYENLISRKCVFCWLSTRFCVPSHKKISPKNPLKSFSYCWGAISAICLSLKVG